MVSLFRPHLTSHNTLNAIHHDNTAASQAQVHSTNRTPHPSLHIGTSVAYTCFTKLLTGHITKHLTTNPNTCLTTHPTHSTSHWNKRHHTRWFVRRPRFPPEICKRIYLDHRKETKWIATVSPKQHWLFYPQCPCLHAWITLMTAEGVMARREWWGRQTATWKGGKARYGRLNF